jgi:hypothetical protein
VKGLKVSEKWKRVRNYQHNIIEGFMELLVASWCNTLEEMNRDLIFKKANNEWLSYSEVYKPLKKNTKFKYETD